MNTDICTAIKYYDKLLQKHIECVIYKRDMKYDRDDWNRFDAAMKAVASRFATTVNVYQKHNRLSVNFDVSKLSQEDADAVSEIENLIELVSEFPENYLVTLEPPNL